MKKFNDDGFDKILNFNNDISDLANFYHELGINRVGSTQVVEKVTAILSNYI